jgi:hypothetical protein
VVVSFLIVFIIYLVVSDLLGLKDIAHIEGIIEGISMLLAGVINYFATQNYYINTDGDREYYEEEGVFMYVPVTLWTKIFFIIGVLIILGAIADIFKL